MRLTTSEDTKLVRQLMEVARSTAEKYASSSPAVSRFRMLELNSMKKLLTVPEASTQTVCVYCGSIYQPGNHQVRLQPKAKRTRKVAQLLRRKAKAGGAWVALGKYQQKLLDDYLKRQNKLIISCHTCKHRTVIPCEEAPRRNICKQAQSEATEVKKSKSAKKRMKKKRKFQASFTEGASDLSPSASSSSSLLHSSGTSAAKSATWIGDVPKFTSTPKLHSGHPVAGKPQASSPASLLPQLPKSSGRDSSGAGSRSTNMKSRQKNRHSMLKSMLDTSKDSQNTGSLKDFLSSLS